MSDPRIAVLDPLAQASARANDALAFRLLSVSLPGVTVDDLSLSLEDVVEAFVEDADGVPSDQPVATLVARRGAASARFELTSGATVDLPGGGRLRMEYALSGAQPGLPVQYAVHFTLLPAD